MEFFNFEYEHLVVDFNAYLKLTMKSSEEIIEIGNRMRAEVIGTACDIENVLADALAHLYCPSKHDTYVPLLAADVFSDLTFEKKITLFCKFLKVLFSESEIKTISKELHYIRETRNQFAHRVLHVPNKEFLTLMVDSGIKEGDVKDSIVFYKHGKKDFQFSQDDLNEFKRIAKSYGSQLYVLTNEILRELLKE